jgi:hypothetical protein
VDQWHHCLGHPALRIVRCVISSHHLPVSSNKPLVVCSSCQQGKSHCLHFGPSPTVSHGPLDLLFLDVWGPAPLLSNANKIFCLCVIDDLSHYSWLFPLTNKTEVSSVFSRFKLLVKNYFNCRIKSVQTDGGGEFIPLQRILATHGISYHQTCPHTHHQNESVEWKPRHIVDTDLALLSHSHVPFQFWDDAFDTASYLINRLPSSINPSKSPFEILFQKSPNYNILKVFGCKC